MKKKANSFVLFTTRCYVTAEQKITFQQQPTPLREPVATCFVAQRKCALTDNATTKHWSTLLINASTQALTLSSGYQQKRAERSRTPREKNEPKQLRRMMRLVLMIMEMLMMVMFINAIVRSDISRLGNEYILSALAEWFGPVHFPFPSFPNQKVVHQIN